MSPSTLAFLAPGLTIGSPAQQLLDRLLAGFPVDGAFRSSPVPHLRLFAPGAPTEEIARRSRDFATILTMTNSEAEALQGAEAAVVAGPGAGDSPDVPRIEAVLSRLPAGSPCFVHGLLGPDRLTAERLGHLAISRGLRLTASTVVSTAPRLPDITLRPGIRVEEALIVVQGPTPQALLHGVEGLMPDLERAGVVFDLPLIIRAFEGQEVWAARRRKEWPEDLLAAALSRSNNPQGDPIRDGRTQDLHGLGLVPSLARNPRAWITRHPDGCRTTVLALDGVVTDINLALRVRRGAVVSTQLYLPPAPNQAAYHDLAAAITDFLQGASAPWTLRHALGAATWHAALRGDAGILP